METTPRIWRDVCLEDLAALAPALLMSRGRGYADRGQVTACVIAGDRLAGSVLGSAGWYTTDAVLSEGRIKTACTCPYQGMPCKHAVALILAWLEAPWSFLDLPGALATRDRLPDLRGLCVDLALAAPRKAVALLAGETDKTGLEAAAAALARGLLSGPRETRDLPALADRLSWVGEQVCLALAAGSREAAGSALDLADRLLSFWADLPPDPRWTQAIGAYLSSLARAWPRSAGDLGLGDCLRRMQRPEYKAFAAEICLLALAAGLPPEPGRGLGDEVASLLVRGPEPGLVKGVSFESLLLLLDAYERWASPREALALAQAGLRRPDEGERYALRRRLAAYHNDLGERRQALAYLAANFRSRPDVASWDQLRRAAQPAGEWLRIKREIWPLVLGGTRELRITAALAEGDRELVAALAETMQNDDPQAIPIWTALAEFQPERSIAFLSAGSRACLGQGGRAARRQAAGFLRALGRVCRRLGRTDRWQEIRAALREEFAPALNWPELGSLLDGPPDRE